MRISSLLKPAPFILVGVLLCTTAGWAQQAEGAGATEPEIVAGFEAVEPPTSVMTGRVLMKDGVTPVSRAEVVLTAELDGRTFTARSGRRGDYKVTLPIGQYRLRIGRRMELFESTSTYQVSAGARLNIDLLLLPNFEKPAAQGSLSAGASRGPDAQPEAPVVVGTVVDLVRRSDGRLSRRWVEALAFIGSVLAVAVAAQ